MLTPSQRSKFFKLARAAWLAVSPGTPFNTWRKEQMIEAGHPASIKELDHIWGYEDMMLRFAVLSYNDDAIGYWTSCIERRLRWVLKGLATDLQALQQRGVEESYIEGIYRQAKMLPEDFEDATAQQLWCVLQILDTRIRSLCTRVNVSLRDLPTAGHPWCFRGIKAKRYAALVALASDRRPDDTKCACAATEALPGSSVRVMSLLA